MTLQTTPTDNNTKKDYISICHLTRLKPLNPKNLKPNFSTCNNKFHAGAIHEGNADRFSNTTPFYHPKIKQKNLPEPAPARFTVL